MSDVKVTRGKKGDVNYVVVEIKGQENVQASFWKDGETGEKIIQLSNGKIVNVQDTREETGGSQ